MAKAQPCPEPVANWALASLPRRDYERLFPDLEAVSLSFGEVLHEPGQRIRFIYFLSSGLVSLLAAGDGGRQAEVAVVGSEQVSQSAVCDHLHPVPKRLCRWLLMTQDRLGSDRLPFTQQFIADILAVRLASASAAARPLQQAGIVHNNRGDIRILDRPGLERVCCGCYRVIKERFAALRTPSA